MPLDERGDGKDRVLVAYYCFYYLFRGLCYRIIRRTLVTDNVVGAVLYVIEHAVELADTRAALEDIQKLALEMEMEANIETLVLSKGFEECVAVISEGKCSVIVETTGLLPGEVAQISEIVYEQSGIVPANLKIIEKNTGV